MCKDLPGLWSSRKEECARRLRLLLAAAPEEPGTSSSGKRSRRPEALRFRFWLGTAAASGRSARPRGGSGVCVMRPAPSSLSAPLSRLAKPPDSGHAEKRRYTRRYTEDTHRRYTPKIHDTASKIHRPRNDAPRLDSVCIELPCRCTSPLASRSRRACSSSEP